MADNSAPVQDATITPEAFRDKAESAGKKLQSRLKEDRHTGIEKPQLVSFRWDKYEDVLHDVVTAFKTEQIGGHRHPGRTVEWVKIYLMTKAIPYDETTSNNATTVDNLGENIFFLALLLGEKEMDKVGRSFSLATRFNIEDGAIYLGYKVL